MLKSFVNFVLFCFVFVFFFNTTVENVAKYVIPVDYTSIDCVSLSSMNDCKNIKLFHCKEPSTSSAPNLPKDGCT